MNPMLVISLHTLAPGVEQLEHLCYLLGVLTLDLLYRTAHHLLFIGGVY